MAKQAKTRDTSLFLPTTAAELSARGIEQLDFVYIIGDAYVDHPSFGPAIISRVLESHGYTVGILSQPDWHSCGGIPPPWQATPCVFDQRGQH